MSDIRDASGNPLVVAGGGGGVGGGTDPVGNVTYATCGGNAGDVPQGGTSNTGIEAAGTAGTATAGGAGGVSNYATCWNASEVPITAGKPGTAGQGGDGVPGDSFCQGGGAGGGGYFGGGGGGNDGGGGGAGSNFVTTTATNIAITTATAGGDGVIVIQPGPTATITTPTPGATYTQGQQATAAFTCASDGSTIASCVDAKGTPSGASIDTATVGTHTITVTATDTLGLTGTATSSYTVTAPQPQTPPTPPAPTALTLTTTASPNTIHAGRMFDWIIVVSASPVQIVPHSRTHATTGVRVCAAIPAGTSVVNRRGGVITRQRICWNVGPINPRASVTRRVTLRANPTTTNRKVTLTATAQTTDPTQPVVRATAHTTIRVLAARTEAPTPPVTG